VKQQQPSTLQQQRAGRKTLGRYCGAAVEEQVSRGEIPATHLRKRRRHLQTQLLKRIPAPARHCRHKLLRAASMLLAVWGFSTIATQSSAFAAIPDASFQHKLLDGFNVSGKSAPFMADIDGDGDLDAFIGERLGTVRFYRNTGTAAIPIFSPDQATNPLRGFDVGNRAIPSLVDIDLDGDLDAFIGSDNGTVKFYINNGTALAPVFAAVLPPANPLVGVAVGTYAAPAFADIDGDGDLDAFVGSSTGSTRFYRNNGTNTAPLFVNIAGAGNPLAGVAVGTHAAPAFVDIDNDGDLDLFSGENYGTIKFYRNKGSATAPLFAADIVGNPISGYDLGYKSTPIFADIDADGDLDAVIGNQFGNIYVYRNFGTVAVPVLAPDRPANPLAGFDAGTRAAPALVDIDFDGDLDAFIGVNGGIQFYRNNGTAAAPLFVADTAGNPLAGIAGLAALSYITPAFADIDGDGDQDLFIGDLPGSVRFYRNTGTSTAAVFTPDAIGNPLAAIVAANHSTPAFADIDGDGDFDAFIGQQTGSVLFYRNAGNSINPVFIPDVAGNPLTSVAVANSSSPSLVDIDGDGDLDAFVGERFGSMRFYRNNGTVTVPAFAADIPGNALAGFDVGYIGAPAAFADIDRDGDIDAFIGLAFGTTMFFENKAVQTVATPANGGNVTISPQTAATNIPSALLWTTPLVTPPAGTFPFGSITYYVNTTIGGTATIRMTFPTVLPTGFTLYKIDAVNNYTAIPAAQYAIINTSTIDLTLTDGGTYDLDGLANGVIIDPMTIGAPTPVPAAAVVPGKPGGCTVNPASDFDPSLLLMLMLSGIYLLRRKPQRGQR